MGDLSTPADVIYGHVILPISQKRAGLPAALDQVMARALATDINDRYQTASEFSDALRNCAHRTGLGCSAPELAAHLREILGSDPDRWLRDEGTPMADAAKVPAQSVGLVGKEAASIGLVPEGPDDEAPPLVLSPNSVSGSKDFDLESMLDDEATRPGVRGRGPAALASPEPGAPLPQGPSTQGLKRGEPPPVWTRSSGPVPIVTPPPARMTTSARVAAPVAPNGSGRAVPPPVPPAGSGRAVPPPMSAANSGRAGQPATAAAKPAAPPPVAPPRSTAPAIRTAAPAASAPLPPPPPVPMTGMAGRIPPRSTQRGMAAVPPPFPSAARPIVPPPAPRPSVQLPVQPVAPAIEEATPPPPLQPAYAPQGYAEQAPPSYGGVAHAQTLMGIGSGLPMGRPQAPAYQMEAAPAQQAYAPAQQAYAPAQQPYAQPVAPAPIPRFQPQMMDFSGSATLPEKSSGPPRWLAIFAIVASLVGGAVLGQRATEGQMLAMSAFDDTRPARPQPTTLDEKSLPPRAPAVVEPSKGPAVEALPPAEPAAVAPAHAPRPAAHARGAAKHHGPPPHHRPGHH